MDLRDTLIAGFALAHEAQLATRKRRHFSDTTISLINPFAPMASPIELNIREMRANLGEPTLPTFACVCRCWRLLQRI